MPRHQGRCHARGGPPGFGSRDAVTGRLAAGLAGLVERARRGDAAALPGLRQALDVNQHLWREFGDLARHAEQSLIDLAAGPDLHLRECLARKVAELRGELGGPGAPPLERLLAERVAVTWLQCAYLGALQAQSPGLPPQQAGQLQRQQDAAQRRHLAAVAALARVRKPLPPAKPPRRAGRPVLPDTPRFAAAPDTSSSLANGVGVLN